MNRFLQSEHQRVWLIAIFAVLFLWCGIALASEEIPKVPADHAKRMATGLALFKEHVRPILVKHCLECHGGKKTKAEFDLSNRRSLSESGMIDEDAQSSHLYALITHSEEPYMPHKKEKLSEAAINHIGRWIDLGAPYDGPLVHKIGKKLAAQGLVVTEADREWWSLRPIENVIPPKVKDESWCRTPIDRFILARLEERGLEPNPPADRHTLIRRAYFDLIGLPPNPEEIDAFVNDQSSDAYEKLIDRLLASPHYGQRWARHWMDVARFGESHGYEMDYDRPYAYHYRDFLIEALNRDMPYDRFVQWQIAGDELAPNDRLAMMATGFLGAGAFPTQLTEVEFESARYDELDDMLSTTCSAVLGLTVGCARCHDHKYDPIPTRDYYQLLSTFTTTIRSEIELDLNRDEYLRAKAVWDERHDPLVADLRNYETEKLTQRFERWLANRPETKRPDSPWQILDFTSPKSKEGSKLTKLGDGSFLAGGENPNRDAYIMTARIHTRRIAALRIEALTHSSLPHDGPGRARSGNFSLADLKVTAKPLRDPDAKPVPAKFGSAKATGEFNKDEASVMASIDKNFTLTGWRLDAQNIGKDQAAVFTFAKPIGFPGGTVLVITMQFGSNVQHNIGRPRLSVTSDVSAPVAVGGGVPQHVAEGLAMLKKRTPAELPAEHRAALLRWYARTDPRWRKLDRAVQKHLETQPQLLRAKVQVTSESFSPTKHHADGKGYPHFYPETHFLERGDPEQKQGVASQNFLQVLMRDGKDFSHWRVTPPGTESQSSFRRASFANWLTDPEYGAGHLAARVYVNRLWHHHFGRGIVATPNNFGSQGARPTHPELLDWLAADLVSRDWKPKRIHKLIMTSAVYMQNGRFDQARGRIDRENRYYWRRTPRRLEAEAIRDAMLRVSGMLDERMFGPGSLDPEMRRRSVYFFIKRSKLIPMMMLFDWPEHLVSIGRRSNTTIAPQALLFMNGPQTRRYAEGFAKRLLGKSIEVAVPEAFVIAFAQPPTDRQAEFAADFLARQTAAYYSYANSDPQRLAMIDLCQSLMGMNEFVYID